MSDLGASSRLLRGMGVALLAVTASACGGASTTTTTAHSEGPPSGASNDNAPGAASDALPASTSATAGRPVDGQILVSGPGFTPTVLRATGAAGGPTEGSAFSPDCVGYFATSPQHVLKIGRALPSLRVMVDADADLTLALRTPDGVWHCNDDSGDPGNGLNPLVDLAPAAAGEVEVYVGAYSEDSLGTPYRLGVTEDSSAVPSSLR